MCNRALLKSCGLRVAACLTLILLPSMLVAQAPPPSFSPQYPIGIEGIKGGSVAPPGFYIRNYTLFYYSDDLPRGPRNFEAAAIVEAPRPIWMTGLKFLGADYGMSMIVPFGWSTLKVGPIDDERFSLGDIAVEPLILAWHLDQFDIGAGYAFWAPTGDYDVDEPAKLGKGYWDHMFTLGGTWFVDKEKTWAISALARYEIPMEHEEFDITPGHALSLEWGLSKTIAGTIDVGIIGYYQQQITEDRGTGNSRAEDHVVGIGPEVSIFWPSLGLFTSLRYVFEVEAENRPEGHTVNLTITKAF